MEKPVPYPGPRPFAKGDADYFFGREREQEEIASLVLAHPAVLILAQSGAGKTSLLNAKIVPRLLARGCEVFARGRVGGDLPGGSATASVKNIFAYNALLTLRKERPVKREGAGPEPAEVATPAPALDDTLASVYGKGGRIDVENAAATLDPADDLPPRVLVFDQFEEIFTAYPDRWDEREKFIAQIGELLWPTEAMPRPNVRILIAMREEFASGLLAYNRALPERMRTRYRLEGLSDVAALEAIKAPALLAGREYDAAAAEKLVKNLLRMPDVGDGVERFLQYVEPLQLQVVCRTLWQKLPKDATRITPQMITDSADVEQALSEYYGECVRETAQAKQIEEGKLHRWFGEKLILPEGIRNLVHGDANHIAGLRTDIVTHLDGVHHLVRSELRGNARWYELSHDRFVGPIRRAYADWRKANDTLAVALESEAAKWSSANRSKKLLWSGSGLKQANDWLRGDGANASDSVKQFVASSRRWQRTLRYCALGIGLTLLLVCVLSWHWFSTAQARNNARVTDEAAVASQLSYAQNLLDYNEPRARAEALETLVRTMDTYQGNAKVGERLVSLLLSPRLWFRALTPPLRTPHDSAIVTASFAPGSNGRTIVAICDDGQMITWPSGQHTGLPLFGGAAPAQDPSGGKVLDNGCLFSRDGRYLLLFINPRDRGSKNPVSVDPLVTAQLYQWKGNGYAPMQTGITLPATMHNRNVTWSDDDKFVAVASIGSRFDTFDLKLYVVSETGCAPAEGLVPEDKEQIAAITFSPDNLFVATGSSENRVRWWTRTGPGGTKLEPDKRSPVDLHFEGRISSLNFGPGKGELFAAGWNESKIIGADNALKPTGWSPQDSFVRLVGSTLKNGKQLVALTRSGHGYVAPAEEVPDRNSHSEPIFFSGNFGLPQFSDDGNRLLILSGTGWNNYHTVQAWDVHDFWTRTLNPAKSPPLVTQNPPPPWISDLADVFAGQKNSAPNGFPTFSDEIGKEPPEDLSEPYKQVWRRYFTHGLPAGPVR